MSSRLTAPNTGAMFLTIDTISSTFCVLMQMGNASMPANSLNKTHLPSMTGMPASAPILPKPRTELPAEMTATVCPLIVQSYTFDWSFAIARHGSATPGVYAKDKSFLVLRENGDVVCNFPLYFL